MFIKYPILALSLLLIIANCSQDVPIQAKEYGFTVGDPYGTLHIQFFLDFLCSDSKQSFNTWTNVRKAISLQQNKVKLTYQFNPLPYHFYAALLHQAFFYVLENSGPSAAENYIAYVFDHQDDFAQEKYLNKTATKFTQQFSQIIANLFKLDAASLAKELVIGSNSWKSLKNHWRYTTIMNGVAGAPIFYANGVLIDGADEYTYINWLDFIKQYKS